MKKIQVLLTVAVITAAMAGLPACQKFDTPPMDFKTEDTAMLSGPLVNYWAFEDGALDSVTSIKSTVANVTFVDGINGKAYQGATNAMLTLPSSGRLATMTSFTVSFWMNTEKHTGGAQSVFMLPRTDDFWGNMFMLIEGNSSTTDNSMLVKFNFAGNWVVFDQTGNANGLNRWPDAYGNWMHVVFRYDESTSKFATFINGTALSLASSVTDRTSGGAPLGALAFTNPSKFALGAYQQQLGSPWSSPDSWMLKYTGMLDQFRIYNIPLTDAEITELYNTKS